MSTDALSWFEQSEIDSPWHRLYWTLPLALLICATVLFWFTYSMEHSAKRTPEPLPVDAQLIELPAPPAVQPRIRQKVIEQPKIKEPVQPPVVPDIPAETARETPPPAIPTVVPPPPSRNTQTSTAQSITRPLPEIPDELREEALREAATARFHIAIDGTASVELIKPTGNPRLNRLLMDKLKKWKFAPATKDGKPVPSTEDIVVRVLVQ